MNSKQETIPKNLPTHTPRPMVDLLVSIVLPTIILMRFSGEEHLGPATALVVALAFPLGWGLFEKLKYKQNNFIAILGLVSILLTGSIGLLELDTQWLAIKEAAIPAIIGIAVLVSTKTRYPLIKTLIYSPTMMNVEKIKYNLEKLGNTLKFEDRLLKATYLLSGTFFFSATINYILATKIVTSPTGTPEFNEELGKLTLLSYPIIAIPSMLMMMAIFYYLWRTISGMTGLKLDEILVAPTSDEKKDNT